MLFNIYDCAFRNFKNYFVFQFSGWNLWIGNFWKVEDFNKLLLA